MFDPLPERIWICGATGSGKSTLAAQIAEAMDVEPLFMDEIHWQPGWTEAPDEEIRAKLQAVVDRPRWVIDGNYTRFRKPHVHKADLHVWLDLPLSVSFGRVFRRTLARSLKGQTCCNGNRESIFRALTHKDSILLWSLSHHRAQRQTNGPLMMGLPHVRLRTPLQVTAWRRQLLAAIQGRRGASTRSSPARRPSARAG